MTELSMLGWVFAAVVALGWWLTSRYDTHEREIVSAVNQLGQRVENEIKPTLAELKQRLVSVEQHVQSSQKN